MKSRLPFILVLIFNFVYMFGCSRVSPAGFWTNFQSVYLQKNLTDQGIQGGYLVMYWESNIENTFSIQTSIDFATKNGWELANQSQFKEDIVNKWKSDNLDIFPLSFSGFTPNGQFQSGNSSKFPRWMGGDITVLSFKTGWISIIPGTDDTNEVNGFVVISKDGRKMSVYHLWGE